MVEFPQCLKCKTECCSGTAVRLFPSELKQILDGYPSVGPQISNLDNDYYLLTFKDKCPFLNSSNLCQLRIDGIEPPLGCQFGPFYVNQEMTSNDTILLMPARNNTCPHSKEIHYTTSFRSTFFKIAHQIKKLNPNTKIITDEKFLLEGDFW